MVVVVVVVSLACAVSVAVVFVRIELMCLLLVEGQILRDDIDYDAIESDLALDVSLMLRQCG